MFPIKILKPTIFQASSITSGVTLSNFELLEKGFSLSAGNILSIKEVKTNRQILAWNIGTNSDKLKFQKQMHGSKIRIISINSDDSDESDGMITNEQNLILNVIIADCAAVLCHDTKNNCIGAFHSGWRGTSEEIVIKGVEMMQQHYGTKSQDLLIYISPCAGGEKYEVGEEIADLFPNSVQKNINGKFLLNIKNEIYKQLIKIHIPENNIEISSICTISNKNFHSFRRDKDKSGRMSAYIGIK